MITVMFYHLYVDVATLCKISWSLVGLLLVVRYLGHEQYVSLIV